MKTFILESSIHERILNDIQHFMSSLDKDLTFIGSNLKLKNNIHIDFAFYNRKLRYSLLVELKSNISNNEIKLETTKKQLRFYIKEYDKQYKLEDDGDTLGLIVSIGNDGDYVTSEYVFSDKSHIPHSDINEEQLRQGVEVKEISKLSHLYSILDTLNIEQEHTRFFRGHSNHEFKLIPSIYRNNFIINEDKIINDVLINCPSYFKTDDSLFDKLVILQHYGYPTRLLDITSNALVALYFAVSNLDDKSDGELIVFDIPNTDIKYDSSDHVSILSAISMRDSKFNIKEYIKVAETGRYAEIAEFLVREHDKLDVDKAFDSLSSINNHGITRDMIRESFKARIQQVGEQAFKKIFNEQVNIVRLIHDIRNDKSGFEPIINYQDFNQVLCVRAKLSNQRIIRQQGAFLLFGMEESGKLIQAKINDTWIKKRIKIPYNCKSTILNSLKSFGISKQSLFPELETQAEDIKKKYEQLSEDKKTSDE